MKYTIEGFNQQYAISLKKDIDENGKTKTIKLDCTDLVILRWFVDFYPKMDKHIIDGEVYVMLSHKKIVEDLPIIDITKRAFIERMKKFVILGILKYQLVKESGTYSYYAFGDNYINLIKHQNDTEGIRSNDIGYTLERDRGIRSNNIGVYDGTYNKDTSIKNKSIKDYSITNNDICAVPKKSATAQAETQEIPPEEIAISIPLVNGTDYNISKTEVEKMKTFYPAIDIMEELRKCAAWNYSNPKNRKTKRGIMRHINGWLSRAQDSARRYPMANRNQSNNASTDFSNLWYDGLEGEDKK